MNQVRELHEKAMDLAEIASVAKLRGDLETAKQLFWQAYENEVQAARLVPDDPSYEPTRSILYRSAASLALDCSDFREAERLIAEGLAGHPPEEIAEELRYLYEKLNFHRHLALRGVSLGPDEVLMSLAGKAIGSGVAMVSEFTRRLDDIQRLLRRTVERVMGKAYSEGGVASGLARHFAFFVSGLQHGSFTVSLKVGTPERQLTLPLTELSSSYIIDEILTCLEFFNASKEAELREKIPDLPYYRHFIGMARRIAPDGDEVDLVGFATDRRRIELTKPGDEIGLSFDTQLDIDMNMETKVEITGRLRYADAIHSEKQTIKLIDEDHRTYYIIVPKGMMSDIVKPLWDETVIVTGFRCGKDIHLGNIKRANTA